MHSLRRAISCAVLTCAVLGAAPGIGRTQPVGGDGGQFAFAGWAFMSSPTRGVYYSAVVLRGVFRNTVQNTAYVGVGRCRGFRGHDFSVVTCSADPDPHLLAPGEFDADPSLSDATLRYGSGADEVQVAWKGQGSSPDVFTGWFEDGRGLQAGALVAADQWATARGHFAGRDLGRGQGPFALAVLSDEATAWVMPGAGQQAVRIAPDGVVTWRFRIPIHAG
ncbi:MAG: hypothetical protein ABR600_04210 [Actinomycetota bacterium]